MAIDVHTPVFLRYPMNTLFLMTYDNVVCTAVMVQMVFL
jgi:hypothetical protein